MLHKYFAFIFAFALLTACNTVHVEHVPLEKPLPVPADARPSPVIFWSVRNAVPLGTTTVGISVRNLRCPLVMRQTEKYFNSANFSNDAYRTVFRDALNGDGYDVAGDPARMFDEEEDQARAVYRVAARITDIKMDVCDEAGLGLLRTTPSAGFVGEAMLQIEWSVFDALKQRNVYKVTTRGYGRLDDPNDEGIPVLLQDAFAAAAHNLGTDKPFFDLVVNGIPPAKPPKTFVDPEDRVLSEFTDRAPLTLPAQHLNTKPAGTGVANYSHVAVFIQNATGSGSGFFIDRDGDLITDAHVVGHAAQVRVVTADKKFSMVADVLRLDPARDVALLRVENMPDKFNIELLPLRLEKPAVGEDVYAVGTPLLSRLQNTVTKGIVSANRYEPARKLWFIQSDVFTYHGNSGGPLLDAKGNILGLCESLHRAGNQDLAGLNYFTPIADALAALHVTVAGQGPVVKAADDGDDNPVANDEPTSVTP